MPCLELMRLVLNVLLDDTILLMVLQNVLGVLMENTILLSELLLVKSVVLVNTPSLVLIPDNVLLVLQEPIPTVLEQVHVLCVLMANMHLLQMHKLV
jgi:hypothetical protein